MIELATQDASEVVLFPELSLTGYEPKGAKELVVDPDDTALRIFQRMSDANAMIICVGAPTRATDGIRISMLIFQPNRPWELYSKQILHADEAPYFTHGTEPAFIRHGGEVIAPAICYESLQPEHARHAAKSGARVYLASVAKSATGVTKASVQYPVIAREHDFTVIMANSIGPCDDFVAAGRSSVWGIGGTLLGQIEPQCEGILVTDTHTGHASVRHA